MKKNYVRITFVTLAILVLSIIIALLSVTALDGDEIAVTSSEYGDILIPVSSEGGLIEGEQPSMGEITMGELIGPTSPIAPNATSVTSSVDFSDGVYALRNIGNGQLWMGIEQNYVTPGYHMQQYAFGYSPADNFTQAGLFKITRVPNTNRFIIRSLLNNCLSFGFEDSENVEEGEDIEVITRIIPANDADVQPKDTFRITFSNSGCIIYPYESESNRTLAVAAHNTTASGAAGAPESYLVQKTKEEAGTRARWELQKYEGENRSSGYITSPSIISKGLTVGIPYTLQAYGWTTIIGANKITLGIPDAYSDIASGVWNDTTESLTVTVHRAGFFRVNLYMYDAEAYDPNSTTNTPVRTFYGNYRAVPPIEDGVSYYLQNVGTKRCMDIEGPSTAEGAIIQQWDFSTATQKKWIFTRESGGYFTIKSAYSNKYVGVDSTNTSVIRQYATKSDYTKWYFESTESGRYAIYCKASAVTGVLASPTATSSNGVNLTTATYTDDTVYRDEWVVTLLPCSGQEIKYDPDSWNDNENIKEYSNCYNYALNKKNAINDESYIFYFMQPGDKADMTFYNSLTGYIDGYKYSYITIKDADTVRNCAAEDAKQFGITFTQVEKHDMCPEGTYKVALVVDLEDDPNVANQIFYSLDEGIIYLTEVADMDYHWYRQNSDGTWSHKPGHTEVINTDEDEKVIYDPEICNRTSSRNDYSVFVGYFAVNSLD